MSMSTATNPATKQAVRQAYREFVHLLKHQQKSSASQSTKQKSLSLRDVRQAFRQPLQEDKGETVESRLQQAESRLAFLRMTSTRMGQSKYQAGKSTAKSDSPNQLESSKDTTDENYTGRTLFVYKDGQRYEVGASTVDGEVTLRDNAGGRVHTNWDGKNLDPDSVRRHKQQLKRAGFVNNLHAKGIF
jgi:hypothetical protein